MKCFTGWLTPKNQAAAGVVGGVIVIQPDKSKITIMLAM